ncbi:MAG: T9SS type A sorting domain-containing protein [Chitinophagales bacterium]
MNTKIYIILFLLSLAINHVSLKAQALSGSPSTFIEVGNYLTEFDIIGYSFIQNNTNEDIEVNWQRTRNDIPEGWNNLICDPVNCWAPFVSGNPQPLVIPANGTMLLNSYFQPNEIEGSGIVEICVWAIADSANVNVKMTYRADAFTVDIEDNALEQIKVYPNPVRDNLTIDIGTETNVRYIEIYNLVGRKMAHYSIPNRTDKYQINASALPEGMYFMKMFGDDYGQNANRTFTKD